MTFKHPHPFANNWSSVGVWTPAVALEGGTTEYWEADKLVTATNSPPQEGDTVSAWASSLGNSVAQATGSKQPLFRAAGINGKAAIDFDGTDDILTKAAKVLDGTVGTLILVYAFDTVAANQTIIAQSYNGDAATWMAIRAGDASGRSTYDFRNGSGDTLQSFNTQSPTTSAGVVRAVMWQTDGTTLTERVNGTVRTVAANRGDWWGDITVNAPNTFSLGGRLRNTEDQYFNGKFSLAYANTVKLGAASIQQINSYLQPKYGVVV